MSSFDPYAALGVEPTASREDIRKAFRAVSRQVHPDLGGSHESFLLLRAAYELLDDHESRRDYDRFAAATPAAPKRPTGARVNATSTAHRCAVPGCRRHHLLSGAHCWLHATASDRDASVSASGRVRCVFVDGENQPCRTVLSAETLISGTPHVCGLHGSFLYEAREASRR